MKKFPYCFIILLFIIYQFYNLKKKEWNSVFNSPSESFSNLSRNFLDNNYYVKQDNIITKTYTPQDFAKIHSNYEYSLESRFAYELSKIYDIEYTYSSLTKNIETLRDFTDEYNSKNYSGVEEHNDIYMCLEQNYYDYIKENNDLGNDVNYICSLYNLELYLIAKEGLNIKKINDIKVYPEYKDNYANNKSLPDKLIIGIPKDNDKDFNGEKILFDILDKDKYKFVYYETKELFSRMKLDSKSEKCVHIIFNISSYKNPFLLEFLRTNNVYIIGTEGIKDSLLNTYFEGTYKKDIDMTKYTVKKGGKFTNMTVKVSDMVKKKTLSFRVCLLCHKSANKLFINNLLTKIYGNLDKFRTKLNNYLFSENNNILEDILEPYHMFYLRDYFTSQYHLGARDFYKKNRFILDKVDNIKDINGKQYTKDDRVFLSKQSLFINDELSKLFN